MGLSARAFSRYIRRRPSSRASTAPTSRSTRRCLDTSGWDIPNLRTRSPTGRSPEARRSRICRRRGSATALNASVVVAARAMKALYITVWLYVKVRVGLAEEHAIHPSAWKVGILRDVDQDGVRLPLHTRSRRW